MLWFLYLPMRGILTKDVMLGVAVPAELGRCVTARKGVNELIEGLCNIEGKAGDIFVLVVNILDGIKCTLGVCLGTMSQ